MAATTALAATLTNAVGAAVVTGMGDFSFAAVGFNFQAPIAQRQMLYLGQCHSAS
ncbi:hypothetical protein [Shewanella algae]|uniref:hypothetical protein n=1 Tax=Shewanella algae TaxID=38313 RepID=UPI0025569D52|nr:hypothetical protein [Shewanella algae]MDL2195568.1 hypothetical protein [Shewanella algae]